MFKRNKGWNKEKHKTVYISLSVLIFTLVACAHILMLGSGMTLKFGFIRFPDAIHLYAIIMSLLMVVMGGYYIIDRD